MLLVNVFETYDYLDILGVILKKIPSCFRGCLAGTSKRVRRNLILAWKSTGMTSRAFTTRVTYKFCSESNIPRHKFISPNWRELYLSGPGRWFGHKPTREDWYLGMAKLGILVSRASVKDSEMYVKHAAAISGSSFHDREGFPYDAALTRAKKFERRNDERAQEFYRVIELALSRGLRDSGISRADR